MAAKRRTPTVPTMVPAINMLIQGTPCLVWTKESTFELVLENQIVTRGTHVLFHDLERADALKKTAARAAVEPDVALLHGLLADADDRLRRMEGALDEALEKLEEHDDQKTGEIEDQALKIRDLKEDAGARQEDFDRMKRRAIKAEDEVMVLRGEASIGSPGADTLRQQLARALEARDSAQASAREIETLATAFALSFRCLDVSRLGTLAAEDQRAIVAATLLITGGA